MKKIIFKIQGGYYFVTGIWPVLHMPSFLAVSGPKTDLWLVKIVGLLTVSIGITLFFRAQKDLFILGISAALSYLVIDCFYVARDVISPIYLLDAGLELLILIVLFITWMKEKID